MADVLKTALMLKERTVVSVELNVNQHTYWGKTTNATVSYLPFPTMQCIKSTVFFIEPGLFEKSRILVDGYSLTYPIRNMRFNFSGTYLALDKCWGHGCSHKCDYDAAKDSPVCSCPPGYALLDDGKTCQGMYSSHKIIDIGLCFTPTFDMIIDDCDYNLFMRKATCTSCFNHKNVVVLYYYYYYDYY